MVLCNDFKLSSVGSSLVTIKPLSSKYKRHNFFKKPKTPVIPAVFHGFACSNGLRTFRTNAKYLHRIHYKYHLELLRCISISTFFLLRDQRCIFRFLSNKFSIFIIFSPIFEFSISNSSEDLHNHMNLIHLNNIINFIVLYIS